EDVLELTRRIRAFHERLRDPASTWFLAVALPESLSLPETERLLAGVRRVGIVPGALFINRALGEHGIVPRAADRVRGLLTIDPTVATVGAPALKPGPVGVPGLERFSRDWRSLDMAESLGPTGSRGDPR